MYRKNRHSRILCCIFLAIILLCAGGCANKSNNYEIKQIPVSFPDDWRIVDIAANDETAFYMISRRPASGQGLEMGQIQIEAIDLATLERKTVYSYSNDDMGFQVSEMQAARDRLFWVRLDVEDNAIYIEELDLSTGEVHVIKEYGTAIWDIALQTDGEYLSWLLISDEESKVNLYDIEKKTTFEIPARADVFCNRINVTEGICSFTTEEGDQAVINVYDIEEQKTLHQIKLEPGTQPFSIAADADRCLYTCFVNGETDGSILFYDYDTKNEQVFIEPEEYMVYGWDYSNGCLFVNDRKSRGIIVIDLDSSERTCLLEQNEQLFVLGKTTTNGNYIALGEDSVPEGEGEPIPTPADYKPTLYYIDIHNHNNGTSVDTEYDGTTAVLLEDTTLSNVYSGLTDDEDQITWTDVSDTVELKKGEIVLVLKETDGMAMVYVLTEDTPMSLYGEIPSECLSQKVEDIEKGNLAIATNQPTYSDRDGEVTGQVTGMVRFLERDGQWCQVETVAYGGEEPQAYWIKADDLSYDFDMTIKGKR